MRDIIRRSDFWSGLVLIALAAVIWRGTAHLPFGTLRAIGPGFFPLVLAILTGLIGGLLLGKTMFPVTETMESWNPRPAILLALATGAFGLLVEPAGLPVAVIASGAIAGLAGDETRPRELMIFLPLAALFAVAAFVWALGVPIPVAPWLTSP